MTQPILLHADPIKRTEVFCDGEEHITIAKPSNPNDGFPNKVTTDACDCEAKPPVTSDEFDALDFGKPDTTVAKDCSSSHSFAGMIKHCTLKVDATGKHPGLHESGTQKWP
jgi:hypothetical protein